ncbi:MAG TPA: hypothetical protein VFP68_09915 [Burkholderiaceae bacterium]|nr:hypothetical protein [Burkholderiaceae bacterium]
MNVARADVSARSPLQRGEVSDDPRCDADGLDRARQQAEAATEESPTSEGHPQAEREGAEDASTATSQRSANSLANLPPPMDAAGNDRRIQAHAKRGERKTSMADDAKAMRNLFARVNGTQAERNADPNYRMALAAQQKTLTSIPLPASPKPQVEPFGKQYDEMRSGWESFKNDVRRNNDEAAESDDGGSITAAVAFTQAPRELGFGLIDAGLALGKGAVSLYDSARAGTLGRDAGNVLHAAQKFGADIFKSDTVRLSASWGDAKAMIGTDRIGVQYKSRGSIDEVTRLTYPWGHDKARVETVLEKNFGKISILPAGARAYGLPIGLDFVPGARQNLSGSRAVTPSANFELGIKGTPVKIAIELRKSGS